MLAGKPRLPIRAECGAAAKGRSSGNDNRVIGRGLLEAHATIGVFQPYIQQTQMAQVDAGPVDEAPQALHRVHFGGHLGEHRGLIAAAGAHFQGLAQIFAPGSNEQCAQMGGVVAGIFVTVGQTVTTGDRLVELEAMKMKVPVMATASGQVNGIKVAVGEAVERGQVLITLA